MCHFENRNGNLLYVFCSLVKRSEDDYSGIFIVWREERGLRYYYTHALSWPEPVFANYKITNENGEISTGSSVGSRLNNDGHFGLFMHLNTGELVDSVLKYMPPEAGMALVRALMV